jgi:hypothetical protein
MVQTAGDEFKFSMHRLSFLFDKLCIVLRSDYVLLPLIPPMAIGREPFYFLSSPSPLLFQRRGNLSV